MKYLNDELWLVVVDVTMDKKLRGGTDVPLHASRSSRGVLRRPWCHGAMADYIHALGHISSL